MSVWVLAGLLACGTPEPQPQPQGSAIEGKPTTVVDEGPTLSDVVAADAAIPAAEVSVRERDLSDAASAAADSKRAPRPDTSKAARANFNPISVPQDGDGVQSWDWPFEVRGRGVDLDGDGNFEGGGRRVRMSDMADLEEDELRERLRELRKR